MIKKIVVMLLSIVVLSATAQTAKVCVSWDTICNTNVTEFVLYYGTNTLAVPVTNFYPAHLDDCGINRPAQINIYKGKYNLVQTVSGYTNTTMIVSNLVKGARYYFTISCRSSGGLESERSAELNTLISLYLTNSVPSKVVGFKIVEIN